MAIVTGDRYIEKLLRFVDDNAGPLIDGALVLKLNPVGLHYVQSRLEALSELESLLAGAPVDYLRAYVSDLGDHRAIEQLRRILRLLTSLKVVSVLPPPGRDPTPLSLVPFGRLRVLELRGCDLSTSAAKGLLELRHTLERIVCHNSTGALRHVFASSIAEIKDSPQWNRLSFVSCACNGLLLMDESLQLLPAVETLDLSRNKFTKVDNLRKCVKLKHLDLGFNNLRTVSSFSRVTCHIVKLVLRNNALTTLHGIENLKSLEDLDVSYNIISNFSELEFLVGLPSLGSLWLEGNPFCCARWFRPQAFSYINHPERLKLDDKEISTREFWKRQLIIASRQKRPASFGFYSPIYDAKREGSSHRRRKKITRLASIGGEGESTYLCSDQDSVSIDNEVQSREEAALSDDDAGIADLMNKVELMKKERSVLWLREFKEWMDHTSENLADRGKQSGTNLCKGPESSLSTKTSEKHRESLRHEPDSFHSSGDEGSPNVLESDSPFVDVPTSSHAHQYFDQMGLKEAIGAAAGRMDLNDEHWSIQNESMTDNLSEQAKGSMADEFTRQQGFKMIENAGISPLATIDSISESHSSAPPGSPPCYRKDILQRRQCLEEEILQLSADSYSAASSDSDTSSSEEDACAFGPMSDIDQVLNENVSNMNRNLGREQHLEILRDKYFDQSKRLPRIENGQCSADPVADKASEVPNVTDSCRSTQSCGDGGFETRDTERCLRKPKRRPVSLIEGNNLVGKIKTSLKLNGSNDFHETEADWSRRGRDDFLEDYFNSNIAESSTQEICRQYIRSYCVLEQDSERRERDLALVLSSEKKLYFMLIAPDDQSGTILRVLACHNVEDVREILVGVGLQVVRITIERGLTYLFMTRSVEKSIQLLYLLEVSGLRGTDHKCCLESLEQVQVNLFEKQIFGGSKVSIFQYAMVLFRHDNHDVNSWFPRSLFVAGVHLLLCVEDLKKFGSLLDDSPVTPYFSLDSFCSITDVSEMVVDAKESRCVSLALTRATSIWYGTGKAGKEVEGVNKEKKTSGSANWKIKWFSEDSLFKFVALVKAIRAGTNKSPLPIQSIS